MTFDMKKEKKWKVIFVHTKWVGMMGPHRGLYLGPTWPKELG